MVEWRGPLADGRALMRVVREELAGVKLIELEPRHDERGAFARAFCRDELAGLGIAVDIAQANLSSSLARGTLRGLHHQLPPSAETKLVTCLRGAIHDVALDLRPDGGSHGHSFAARLTEENRHVMVIPPGCAHGFLTLSDDVLVLYFVSAAYDPVQERGVRWDDPAYGIEWPFVPLLVSERDRSHPLALAAQRLAAA